MGLDQDVKIVEGEDKLTLIPNLTKSKLVFLIIPIVGSMLMLAFQSVLLYIFNSHHYTFSYSDIFWLLGLPILVYLFVIFLTTRVSGLKKTMQVSPLNYYQLIVTISSLNLLIGVGITPIFFMSTVTKWSLVYVLAVNNLNLMIYLTLMQLASTFHSFTILEKTGNNILGYFHLSYYIFPFIKMQTNLTFKSHEPMKMRFTIKDWNRERNAKLTDEATISSSYSYTYEEFLDLKEGRGKNFVFALYGPLEQDKNLLGGLIIVSEKKKQILECIQVISRFCEIEFVKAPTTIVKSYLSGGSVHETVTEEKSPEQILSEMMK